MCIRGLDVYFQGTQTRFFHRKHAVLVEDNIPGTPRQSFVLDMSSFFFFFDCSRRVVDKT